MDVGRTKVTSHSTGGYNIKQGRKDDEETDRGGAPNPQYAQEGVRGVRDLQDAQDTPPNGIGLDFREAEARRPKAPSQCTRYLRPE